MERRCKDRRKNGTSYLEHQAMSSGGSSSEVTLVKKMAKE